MKFRSNVGELKFGNTDDIRNLFKHEEQDFSTWMVENIDLLSSRVGLNLVVERPEMMVGGFRADILCRDGQGNRVIIENQLERSNHDHLGKLLTYMRNLQAETGIWITPNIRPEHQSVIEGLNSSKTGFAVYLVKLEAIQIDNSRLAPLFSVLLRPSFEPLPTGEINKVADPETTTPPNLNGDIPLPNVWCIFPRRDEETYQLFLSKNVIGLGFGNLGDLRNLEPTREAFKAQWHKKWPILSDAQIQTFYAMHYSFLQSVAKRDLVIYAPTWHERKIYVGEVSGDYQYIKGQREGYEDTRSVKWLASLDRDKFSPEAQKGISVNLAFFQIRNEQFLQELATKLNE